MGNLILIECSYWDGLGWLGAERWCHVIHLQCTCRSDAVDPLVALWAQTASVLVSSVFIDLVPKRNWSSCAFLTVWLISYLPRVHSPTWHKKTQWIPRCHTDNKYSMYITKQGNNVESWKLKLNIVADTLNHQGSDFDLVNGSPNHSLRGSL